MLTTDICKAYLQISIREDEPDTLSFLWIDKTPASGTDEPAILEWCKMQVLCRASSNLFLLAAALRHHLPAMWTLCPNNLSILEHLFYVDNLVIGTASEAHGRCIYNEVNTNIAAARMEHHE